MPDKKKQYKEGQFLDEEKADKLAKKAGWWGKGGKRKDLPKDHQYYDVADMSAIMQDEKGQYAVNLMDDEMYFPKEGRTNPRDTIRATDPSGSFMHKPERGYPYDPTKSEGVNEYNPFALKSLLKNKEAENKSRGKKVNK